jgi:hypothetical protein
LSFEGVTSPIVLKVEGITNEVLKGRWKLKLWYDINSLTGTTNHTPYEGPEYLLQMNVRPVSVCETTTFSQPNLEKVFFYKL